MFGCMHIFTKAVCTRKVSFCELFAHSVTSKLHFCELFAHSVTSKLHSITTESVSHVSDLVKVIQLLGIVDIGLLA